MTLAVCCFCGEFKHGSLVPCPQCGKKPEIKKDFIYSLYLSDHYLTPDQINNIHLTIKRNGEIKIPPHLEKELAEAVSFSSIENMTSPLADNGMAIRDIFYRIYDKAIEIGKSYYSFRVFVLRKTTGLLAAIRRLFCLYDYSELVELSNKNLSQANSLNDQLAALSPLNDNECVFLDALDRHAKALKSYGAVLVLQADFLLRKSKGVSDENTDFIAWSKLNSNYEKTFNEYSESGRLLITTKVKLE